MPSTHVNCYSAWLNETRHLEAHKIILNWFRVSVCVQIDYQRKSSIYLPCVWCYIQRQILYAEINFG